MVKKMTNSRTNKNRICPECGVRELDKYKQKCSECVQVTRDITLLKTWHTYSNSEKGKATIKNYQRKYRKERYNNDPEFRAKHIKSVKEYNQRKKQQEKEKQEFREKILIRG